MYIPQQMLKVLHEDRVKELKKLNGSRKRDNGSPALWQRVWASLRNLGQQESKPKHTPQPARLSTSEWVTVGKK